MPNLPNCRSGVALVIGVGEYLRAERIEPLRFATPDADALADALTNPSLCAFPREQVILLTNQNAHRDEVVQRLSKWLPQQTRATEIVFIYFAGHGMVQLVGRREEGFLLPYDADPDDMVTRGIAMRDLARWIDGLDARAVVVCLDCCHAGKMIGQRSVSPVSRNMELRPAILQSMAGRGRYLIASCDEGQKSYECADLGHGLFTFHLLEGLAGAADKDGDGKVGLAELFNYVSAAVAREALERFGSEQKPWTSATWAEETYISTPTLRPALAVGDALERLWREQGQAAALAEIERTLPDADEERLKRSLRFLGRVKEPTGVPILFRCLGHAAEGVRAEARAAVHALGWKTVVEVIQGLARHPEPTVLSAILDGLNAFEAHPQVVSLLDQLIVLLKGELRNRAILLRERKGLCLELDEVTALFQEIRSPYQIQRVLGQGLFTATYLACDEGTGLEVVVRVLRPEFANQPQVRARFLDLCNQSVHLVHEKLALTREARAFPERNMYFAVRDHIPGVTLQRVLEAGRRFQAEQIVRLLGDTAEALTPLHRRGICHGGIKPSNIFLCEGDRVMLGDPTLPMQGIGLALERLAYDYRYAAPEMFLGGAQVGPAADFYALGCVAYELGCEVPPFVSDNFHELVSCHLHGTIIPPAQRGSRLGIQGDGIVLRLLAQASTERYGTLAEVLSVLAVWEDALMAPDSEGQTLASLPPRSLLHTASMVRYREAQSVVDFERPADEPLGGIPAEVGPVETVSQLPQVPGYEVLEHLGQGGLGDVYKAKDLKANRLVALKMLSAAASRDRTVRFRIEAEAVARLRHPNIVQSYGLIEYPGGMCLVLEYVAGGDLARQMREWLGRKETVPVRVVAELVTTLARAVDFAHARGILHRDLKPSNILLTQEGAVKIADFGLAKIHEHIDPEVTATLTGAILGTPLYMAPEQWRGMSASPATDIYALGVILYELLTGKRPFPARANQFFTLMELTVKQHPPAPRKLRREIPAELEGICLKCLEKDPARRYLSAAALAEELDRWLRGEPSTDETGSVWQRLLRFLTFRRG